MHMQHLMSSDQKICYELQNGSSFAGAVTKLSLKEARPRDSIVSSSCHTRRRASDLAHVDQYLEDLARTAAPTRKLIGQTPYPTITVVSMVRSRPVAVLVRPRSLSSWDAKTGKPTNNFAGTIMYLSQWFCHSDFPIENVTPWQWKGYYSYFRTGSGCGCSVDVLTNGSVLTA